MRPMLHRRYLLKFPVRVAAALFVCALAGAASPQDGVSEGALKAAIVTNFLQFVDWPDGFGANLVCVAGRGEAADAILAVQGKVVKGRDVETARLAIPDAVPGRRCKILFIGGAERRAIEFAHAAAGSPTLIVAEGDVLPIDQVHVVLALEQRQPVLLINRTESRRSGLEISSRLLRLARKVV